METTVRRVRDIFGQKCLIRVCEVCGKIKKTGSWVELTAQYSQELSRRSNGFYLKKEVCRQCGGLSNL